MVKNGSPPIFSPSRWRLALLMILLLVFVAGYLLGMGSGKTLLQKYLSVREQRDDLEADIEVLRNEVAVHKHGGEVERLASEQLRRELGQQQARIKELERTMAFYQGVVAPANTRPGLALHSFDISRTGRSEVYWFRAVLVQPVDAERDTRGTLKISVEGIHSGSRIRLEGTGLTGSEKPATFSFKVLGEVVGEMRLPESFVPERVRIVVESQHRKESFTEELPWQPE
jgi:hypothetical protein